MKKIWLIVTLVCLFQSVVAQERKNYLHLYNPEADKDSAIQTATEKAGREGKNVLLQIGGNWCIWCKYFHNMLEQNDSLKRLMNQNYEVVYVAYEKADKANPIWAKLGFPQRFGFPVFVILNAKGERIHIQNSVYLEEGKGYDEERVKEFLQQWTPEAVSGQSIK